MANDKRIVEGGQSVSYTCANYRFRTNTESGFAHGSNVARGSVFPEALACNADGSSLWLEHVVDDSEGSFYWLMWYDAQGKPTIPLSGILTRDHISNMAVMLTKVIP